MIKKSALLAAAAALALAAFASAPASAADLKSIGITVGSLGNPFFVQVVKGAEARGQADRRPQRHGHGGLGRL